jgi:hypothetical protein
MFRLRLGLGPGLQSLIPPNPTDPSEYINPKVDPRLNSILAKRDSPLQLGMIQQTDDVIQPGSGSPQKYPYACRFMFNPNVITVSYQVAEGVTPPSQLTADQLAATAIYPGQTSIGFSLLFDRTYEVAYGPSPYNPRDLRKIGVYRDINALEAVVGARYSSGVATNSGSTDLEVEKGASRGAGADVSGALTGNMLMIPVHIIFGGGRLAGGNAGMAYVGTITSLVVNYTLFSQNMVPMRAVVDIGMQQIIGRSPRDILKGGGDLVQRVRGNTQFLAAEGIGLTRAELGLPAQ